MLVTAVPQNELLGVLQLDGLATPKSLRVELFDEAGKVASETLSGGSRLFVFSGVLQPGKEYRVAVNEADLRSLQALTSSVSFRTPAHDQADLVKQVLIRLTPRDRSPDVERSTSNIFGIIFVVLVTSICMNLQAVSSPMPVTCPDQGMASCAERQAEGSVQFKQFIRFGGQEEAQEILALLSHLPVSCKLFGCIVLG